MRTAVWVWCTAVVAWLLPLGSWSVTRLAPLVAVAVGAMLLTTGFALAYAHRSLSSTVEVRTAMDEVRRLQRAARAARPDVDRGAPR